MGPTLRDLFAWRVAGWALAALLACAPVGAQASDAERVAQSGGAEPSDGSTMEQVLEPTLEAAEELDEAVTPAPDAARGEVKWDSLAGPRETMFTFLEAMNNALLGRAGAWERALKTLDTSGLGEGQDAWEAAEALKSVLDRLGEVKVTDLPDGEAAGELGIRRYRFFPGGTAHNWVWEAGVVPDGKIVLAQTGEQRWQFTAETVAGAEALFESMKGLPPQYDPTDRAGVIATRLGPTFANTRWWEWGALLLFIFVGLAGGKVSAGLLGRTADRFRRIEAPLRATAVEATVNPVNLALFTLGLTVGLTFIHFEEALSEFRARVLMLLYIIALGWGLYNLVDLVAVALRRLTDKTDSKLDDMIAPLIRRAIRIFLILVFAIFILQNVFELDITGFLAGLGIAGLAISLAAQDSVKNLFGSLTIFFDKPFTLGDFITFDNESGIVEEIGFRSTRIRLLSGHLVTVPNMKFIDGKVENISARPYIRREMNITITYDTPAEKIDRAVEVLREVLHDDEVVEQGRFDMENQSPKLSFSDFNDASLNIKAYYWYQLKGDPDRGWFTYLEHCQLVNSKLFRRYGEEGIDFAFPTQTLYLAGDPNRRLSVHVVGDRGLPAPGETGDGG